MPITQNQHSWAQDTLRSLGYAIQELYVVRDRPWSCVSCYKTSKGKIYLKSMAAPYANEAILLQFLADQGIQNITQVIASNDVLSCFLMEDAGQPLRENQTSAFDLNVFCRYLQIYAGIQIKCIPLIEGLFAQGVNDWRLEKLPHLYEDFIQKREILLDDGLTLFEIDQLEQAVPKIRVLFEKLASYGISETIEHGDFHDNNILVQGDILTINDWGDSSISHPFFSLAAALDSAKRNHDLQESDERYGVAQDAYLVKWLEFAPMDTLREAFEGAKILHRFVFSLGFSRIKMCPRIEEFPKFKGYVAGSLRELLSEMQTFNIQEKTP